MSDIREEVKKHIREEVSRCLNRDFKDQTSDVVFLQLMSNGSGILPSDVKQIVDEEVNRVNGILR